MIRVNLLPVQKRARVTNVEKELILFVLLLIGLGIGLFSAYGWIGSKVSGLEKTKKQQLAVKSELQGKLKKYHEMEAALEEVSAKLQAIRSIRKDQSLPVRYVDVLVSRLPEEKLWYESLTLNRNGQVGMSGVALDNQAFAQYVNNLRESPYIKGVTISKTSRRTISGLDLVSFTCRINAGPQTEEGQS